MAVGETVTVHVNWTDNGSTDPDRTIVIDQCGITYTARFAPDSPGPTPPPTPDKYTITVTANPSNGGTVTGGGQYDDGASVTIRATANSGYTFTNWTNSSQVVTTNPYTFTATSNASFIANFTSAGPTQTTFYWKSANTLEELQVPISQYNTGTYSSLPYILDLGSQSTDGRFKVITAFVVPNGRSVSGVWTDALGSSESFQCTSNYSCYATNVPTGYTCLVGFPSTDSVYGYSSAKFTIQ